MLFFNSSFGQSVLNPNDPVITYNPASPPTEPQYGQIGKWVRSKKLGWNTDEYKCYIYKGYPFRLHFPKTYNPTANDGKKYPILIFFHGLGESSTTAYDNEYQLYHGGDVFQAAVDNGEFDGYVFFMQSSGYFGTYQIQYITEILNYMIANNKLDPFAITVNGLSAGGQAVWDMTNTYPNYISGAVPMSSISYSYASQTYINKIKFTPILDIQGGQDGSPSPYTAHQVLDAMVNAGANFKYTEFITQGHNTWDSTWLLPDFFPFLLRAYSANPWALFGKTKFCPGDNIDATLGLAPGFNAYQWRLNGNIISGATSQTLHVTQTGTYDARVKRNGIWSDWSRIPIQIIVQTPSKTPPITVDGLMSTALPAGDGKNFVNLKVSGNDSYKNYTWKKVGSDSVYSKQPVFTATQPGYYIVNALPVDGCSSLYSSAFKVIDANGPDAPNAVKSIKVNPVSNTNVSLAWSPFANQAHPPFAFEIYRRTGTETYSFIGQVAASVTNFTDNSVSPKTKYYYAVRAVDSTAAAALSNETSVVTYSDTTAPSIPINLHTTYKTPSTVSVEWEASADNVSVDHYNVYLNDRLTNVTKQTAFVFTSLVKNQPYAIYVKAADSSGNISAPSNQITVQPGLGGLKYSYYKTAVPWNALPDFSILTPVKTGVSPNVDVRVVNQNRLNGFVWQGYINIPVTGTYTFKTTSDDGSALWFNAFTAVGKRLVDNDGQHSTVTKAATLTITAGIYPIYIQYFHNTAAGNMSVSWSCKELFGNTNTRPIADSFFYSTPTRIGQVPAMPANLTATTESYNQIKLTWKDNSNNETGFEIYRLVLTAHTYKIVGTVTANTTTFTDSALLPSKKYYYKIQAINKYGNSGLTAVDSAITLALPAAPATPSNFKAIAASSSRINLSWSNVADAKGYQLLRSVRDSLHYILLSTLPANSVSYSDTGLNSNLRHYYQLQAIGNGQTLSGKSIAFATTKNTAPVISKLGIIKVPHDFTTSIPLKASDADGDALIFKAKKLPVFASIHNYGNDSASLIIKPAQTDLGTYYNLNIIVKDPYGSKDSTVFKLIVNNNFAPTIDPIADYTLNENESLNIPLTAHDTNGDALTWSVSDIPNSFNVIPGSNGHATLVLHPNYLAAGSYIAAVTVSDGKGGVATRHFNVTVKDFNPNTNVYVRFHYTDTIGKPWNSITGLTSNNLIDASGKTTGIGLKLNTSWFATFNSGPTTGDNSGVYPDAVLKDYYYFGIYGGPETVNTKITGLDTSRLYNLTFYAGSNYPEVPDNGSTIYSVGHIADTLDVQGNTENTVTIPNVKPAADGSITYTMSKNSDAQVGYLNALVISSLYKDDGTKPATPTSLTAQDISSGVQLSWNDAAYNEAGYNIYRAIGADENYVVIAKTASETSDFIDSSVNGNTRYFYKVEAFNTNGNSNYSNRVAITTLNRAPEILPINDVVLNNDKSTTVQIKATDDGTDHITLSANGLPSFATLTDNGNGTAKIIISPAVNDIGAFRVTIIATDKYKIADSTSFSILIKDPNVSSTYLSFSNSAHSLPSPWNLIGPYAFKGTSFNNLKDDNNDTTGIKLTFKNGFEGIVESGMQPVEGYGIYPNIIMRTGAYEGSAKKDTIQLSGLSSLKRYNFVFFNSHDDGLLSNTNFTIGAKTVTLNATDNINKTVEINGIQPPANGIINIVVSKIAGSDYAFISTLIIQSYNASIQNLAPANLRVRGVTRNSVSIMWDDRSSSETKYEIWRANSGDATYKLLTTVATDINSYTDASVGSDKTYYYAVKAVSGSAQSNFSNTVSATTYTYNVYTNFTVSNDAVLPWNNLNAVPQIGYTWDDFFDEKGMITGIGMQLNTVWAGLYSAGMNTPGIFPDTVMIDSYGLFPGQTANFTITGLNINMKYDFTFFASSQAYGDVNVAYTINGVTTLLNTSLNVNGTQTIYNVTPDKYGSVTITVAPGTPASQFGLIGALVIGCYTPSSSNVVPVLPATSGFKSNDSTKQVVANVTKQENVDLIAFPNPFHNYLMLSVPAQITGNKWQVMMYDVKGNVVYNKEFANIEKGNSLKITTNENLAAGIYTLVITDADSKEVKTIKLIKR